MAGATELTLDDRARIEALLTEYGWRIDHGGDVSELFAPEGVVIAPGVGLTLQGRDAIGSHFTARAANTSQVTRHVWCDLRVADFARDAARLHTTQMTFLRDSSDMPSRRFAIGSSGASASSRRNSVAAPSRSSTPSGRTASVPR